MPKLVFDKLEDRIYETGVSECVLYPQGVGGTYPKGVAWNGITSINENPSGAEATPLYADNIKYLNLMSAEEFGASIECYTYPDEFGVCNGEAELTAGVAISQQKRTPFGLVYKTKVGNGVDGDEHGYKIHIIYGALAAPSQRAYNSVNDSPEAITFSYELTTTPVAVAGHKPTAHLVIDSTKVTPEKIAAVEKKLYGDDAGEATLPLPDEILTIINQAGVAV